MKESRSNIKQIVVMRKDLGMRKGKMIAQGGHAVLGVFLERIQEVTINESEKGHLIHLTEEMEQWIKGYNTKICVGVDSEEELVHIYEQAKEADLPVYIVTDAGLTEFGGVPTKTCLAIGPADAKAIDAITSHLKLL